MKKRKTMLFSDDEKKLIEANEMLTDESLNLVMGLIHEQFPRIGGLTDSSKGKCLILCPVKMVILKYCTQVLCTRFVSQI